MKPLDDALRQLGRDIPPARDLWPEIAAQIAARGPAATRKSHRTPRFARAAVAASVTLLIATSVWLARQPDVRRIVAAPTLAARPAALQTLGPGYLRDRERLLASFPQQLAGLPPESRAKVAASLADIHKALRDIGAALEQDSGSALLQELLINTCQDEMRVLMAVQEAGAAGRTV
jgi:hypothetical protein